MKTFRKIGLAVLAGAMSFQVSHALAQSQAPYPARTVTIIAPITPGGNPDIVARLVAQRLSEKLGKPFVVENKPGSGGNIGTSQVAKSAPDGYTLGLLTSAEMAINPNLYRNLSFNAMKDLRPVAFLATVPTVLAVNTALPVKTMSELIGYAKSNPGKLNFGSSGNGSIHHFTASLFGTSAGITMTHIPYKGSSQTVPALVAGDIQLSFVGIPLAKDLAEKGRLRLLGISSSTRSKSLPDTPTMDEAGLKGFNVVTTMGIFAPRGTPPEVGRFLATEISSILAEPEIQKRLEGLGMVLEGLTPEKYEQNLVDENKRYEVTVRQLGLTID